MIGATAIAAFSGYRAGHPVVVDNLAGMEGCVDR